MFWGALLIWKNIDFLPRKSITSLVVNNKKITNIMFFLCLIFFQGIFLTFSFSELSCVFIYYSFIFIVNLLSVLTHKNKLSFCPYSLKPISFLSSSIFIHLHLIKKWNFFLLLKIYRKINFYYSRFCPSRRSFLSWFMFLQHRICILENSILT